MKTITSPETLVTRYLPEYLELHPSRRHFHSFKIRMSNLALLRYPCPPIFLRVLNSQRTFVRSRCGRHIIIAFQLNSQTSVRFLQLRSGNCSPSQKSLVVYTITSQSWLKFHIKSSQRRGDSFLNH